MKTKLSHIASLLLISALSLLISGCQGEQSPTWSGESAPRDGSAQPSFDLGKGDSSAGSISEASTPPLQALYITTYNNRWHDYEAQQAQLLDALSRELKIEFDLVGKDPEDAKALMDVPYFGVAYDVIIYNMCLADDFELERINNIISQTRDEGVPAVLLHCAMHSFRQSSPSYPEQQLELRAAEWDWAERHPELEFPYWWRFTGLDSLSHDWARGFTASSEGLDHPITSGLPARIELDRDELYREIKVKEGVTPLLTAYSVESQREHLVAWTHQVGVGQVFATTLGHDHNTLSRPELHQLIAQGIAHITGRLKPNGQRTAELRGSQPSPNYQATVVCQPSDIVHATSVEEVQAVVRRALDERRSLKVISVPRSNSNSPFVCPEHGGILLNLGDMNRLLEVDRERMTIKVEPGIRAFELSQQLHELDLAIPAMPDFTGVSIAGGVATSAHHSSLQISSSMADMVESMLIIDGQGQLRQLQGPELAGAATHLGLLGVVVELELRVEPQFKLRYGHEKGSDEGLEQRIESLVRAHDYARVMWFAGNERYVLDYYDRVDSETSGRSRHNLWSSTGSVFRFVGDLPYRALNQLPLRAQCDGALLRSQVWLAPIKTIDSPRSNPVGWSHEMLGSTCSSGECPWDHDKVRSRTMEASFPLRRLPEWMAEVRALLSKRRACFPILGIYLRFSKASDRWLGFNYGEDMVSFEIHIPKIAAETYHERSADVYDELMQLTLARYDGRPHWGKNSAPLFVGIGERQYPRWADFLELKRELDPQGLFENKIWRQMSGEAAIRPFAGCALSRSCTCSEDLHCGDGYYCDQGVLFSEARVCRPE